MKNDSSKLPGVALMISFSIEVFFTKRITRSERVYLIDINTNESSVSPVFKGAKLIADVLNQTHNRTR